VVVPAGAAHRFENTGTETLELTSIQPVAEMKTEWL
jgi:mannose-6-phosphate isomerase-like protein (cupin superfamily)